MTASTTNMVEESTHPKPDAGAEPGPWRVFAALSVVIILSVIATTFPDSVVAGTLAFFAWALFLLRGVVDLPGELQLIWKDDDEAVAGAESDGESPERVEDL